MEFALALHELFRRRRLLAAGVAVAAIAAVLSVYRVGFVSVTPRALQYSSATTQLLVDSPSSVLGNLKQSLEPLTARASVYANFMASPSVLELIGKQAGIPGNQIYAAGPVNAAEPRVEQEPTALKRNVQLTGETKPYRLNYTSQIDLPTIGIYAQAPTTVQAKRLANGAVVGLQQYLAQTQKETHTPPDAMVTVRQLGHATGAVVDGGIKKSLAVLVFFGVLLLWCIGMLLGSRFLETWRATREESPTGEEPATAAVNGAAAVAPDSATQAPAAAQAAEEPAEGEAALDGIRIVVDEPEASGAAPVTNGAHAHAGENGAVHGHGAGITAGPEDLLDESPDGPASRSGASAEAGEPSVR